MNNFRKSFKTKRKKEKKESEQYNEIKKHETKRN